MKNKPDKIELIRKKADDKIKLAKIRNDIDIEKLSLDNRLLNAKNEVLEIRYNNTLLENKTGLFDRFRTSGRVLNLLSILSFLVSTSVGLICAYVVIKDAILFVGIGLILAICQLIMFISSKYTSITKNKFNHKYTGLKIMQLSILLVTITLNIRFIYISFNSLIMTLIFTPVCFVLDYSTIHFSGMSYDFKNLIFNVSKEKTSLLNKLIDNIFFKVRIQIEDTYNKNHNVKIIVAESGDVETNVAELGDSETNVAELGDSETNVAELGDVKIIAEEAKKDVKTDVKTNKVIMLKDNVKSLKRVKTDVKTDVKRTNVKNVKRYLVKNYNDNELVDVKTLKDKFNLTAREWQTVKKEIAELVTKGTNTYYILKEEEALK